MRSIASPTPIMWLFNATTNGVMRLTGHDTKNETEAYSEEEIKLLLEESAESGSIEQDQYQYLDNIFDLDDKDAKAIMTPRTEVLAIDYDDDLETNLDFMGKNKFTRYPVFREDKDNIVGFVHIKDAYLLPEGSTMKDLKIRSIQRCRRAFPSRSFCRCCRLSTRRSPWWLTSMAARLASSP